MTSHLREDRIHDYVDDLLCHEERTEAEQHLRVCDVCRAEVAAVRDLVAGLHAVPAAVQPERDLLAQIHARMDDRVENAAVIDIATARGVSPITDDGLFADASIADATAPTLDAPLADRTLWSLRYPLAAAAVILVLLSVAVTTVMVRGGAGDEQTANAPERVSDPRAVLANRQAPLNAVEQRYRAAANDLEALLDAKRSTLTPETIRLVEDNLRVIDAALGEARAALREDPANPALTDLVRSAYEKKIDLLRHATETRGET